MNSSKDHELFDIAPAEQIVGTQILQPNLPSNIDFDQKEPIELTDFHSKPLRFDLNKIDFDKEQIKSYSVKGKNQFTVEPLFRKNTLITTTISSYYVKCFNDEFTPGIKGIWESLVGYVNRQILIDQGYIYLLQRQKEGCLVLNHWKLTNLFKVFIDRQQSKLRLILKEDGSEALLTKDYKTPHITELMNKLNQQINVIGWQLVG